MNPIERVDRFLVLMAERRLDEAQAMMAPGCTIVFPPSRRFASLAEVAAATPGRYRWVDKRRTDWDVIERDDGVTVVYSRGTLFGENRHGVAFEGIRYIDRFELKDGLITYQEAWNDLAESGVLEWTAAPAAAGRSPAG